MRRNAEYLLVGLVTGVALGLLAGLLYAPSSGYKTRQRLANDALRAADTARALAERAEQAADLIAGRVGHYLGRDDEEAAWRKVNEIREELHGYTRTQAG